MRRRLGALWLLLAACSATHELPGAPGDRRGDPDAATIAPDARIVSDAGTDAYVPRIPEAIAAAARGAFAYRSGAMPSETLGEEVPIGPALPIDHFIILMQESRSFDAYFGTMPGVDGIPAGTTNPRGDGSLVAPQHASAYCVADTQHSWNAAHAEAHEGANDGFVIANDPSGERALGYLDESDLPFYWDLARSFAMSDHHFGSVLAPTWPNRSYAIAASSFGMVDNSSAPTDRQPVSGGADRIIMQALDRAGVSWSIYYEAVPFVWACAPTWGTEPAQRRRMRPFADLYTDLESGHVASVVWVEPSWTSGNTSAHDEHPPADPQLGQAWVRDVITHVMQSPIWSTTAIVLTWSQAGGFYDHVAPPAAAPPGDYGPTLGTDDVAGSFDRYGLRVPLIVVSPHARSGYVSDRVTDHASILRLVETRFSIPALTARDANAWPLIDMFDAPSTNGTRASDLAQAPVDAAQQASCLANF